jgi:hypothetical protein
MMAGMFTHANLFTQPWSGETAPVQDGIMAFWNAMYSCIASRKRGCASTACNSASNSSALSSIASGTFLDTRRQNNPRHKQAKQSRGAHANTHVCAQAQMGTVQVIPFALCLLCTHNRERESQPATSLRCRVPETQDRVCTRAWPPSESTPVVSGRRGAQIWQGGNTKGGLDGFKPVQVGRMWRADLFVPWVRGVHGVVG